MYVFLLLLWKFIASCLEYTCLTMPQCPDLIAAELHASVGVIGCPNSCFNRRGGKKKKSIFSPLDRNTLGKNLQMLCFKQPVCISGIEIQPIGALRQLLLPQMVDKH